MTAACAFPICDSPATAANRAGQPTCNLHQSVVVGASGSYVNDRHLEGGHG